MSSAPAPRFVPINLWRPQAGGSQTGKDVHLETTATAAAGNEANGKGVDEGDDEANGKEGDEGDDDLDGRIARPRIDSHLELETDISDYEPSASDRSSSEGEGEAWDDKSSSGHGDWEREARGDRATGRAVGAAMTATGKPAKKRRRPATLAVDGGTATGDIRDDAASMGERERKRFRGHVNHAYLDLLNADIQDAASQMVGGGVADAPGGGGGPPLTASQVGMVLWTAWEKQRLWEAVARIGRDNTAAIAARVGSKGELEVAQYLQQTRHELARRRRQLRDGGQDGAPSSVKLLAAAEFPAAVEISRACCKALEREADVVAARQDAVEEAAERRKWGADHVVSVFNVEELGGKKPEPEEPEEQDGPAPRAMPSPAFALLHVPNMLRLAERVFMNGRAPEDNWRFVGHYGDRLDAPPSIRQTALEDLYGLARSVTQRLTAATLYVSMSRIRAKEAPAHRRPQRVVRRRDVAAAVASLGLEANSRQFWAGCPRRLRLRVFRHDPAAREAKRTTGWYISHDEAERELTGVGPEDGKTEAEDDEEEDDDDELLPEPNAGSEDDDPESNAGSEDESDDSVQAEADELIRYAALGFSERSHARASLVKRIERQRREEAYADALDRQASRQEEARLWGMLGREPPSPDLSGDGPNGDGSHNDEAVLEAQRGKMASERFFDAHDDWREHAPRLSEWEHYF